MENQKVIDVHVATISRIDGLDRLSFSQAINHLVEKYPDASRESGVFKCECGIPENHIINEWIEFLDDIGWWVSSWMDDATEITLYTLGYGVPNEQITAEVMDA